MIGMLASASRNPGRLQPLKQQQGNEPILNDQPDALMWFVQVNDLHISRFHGQYVERFKKFCANSIPLIRPSFVIAAGDLTDAFKTKNRMESGQQEV